MTPAPQEFLVAPGTSSPFHGQTGRSFAPSSWSSMPVTRAGRAVPEDQTSTPDQTAASAAGSRTAENSRPDPAAANPGASDPVRRPVLVRPAGRNRPVRARPVRATRERPGAAAVRSPPDREWRNREPENWGQRDRGRRNREPGERMEASQRSIQLGPAAGTWAQPARAEPTAPVPAAATADQTAPASPSMSASQPAPRDQPGPRDQLIHTDQNQPTAADRTGRGRTG